MNPIEIERKITRGKNISLTVYQNGKVILKHPARMPKIQIENFLADKELWILSRLEKIPKNIPKTLKFEEGEFIHIFGEKVKIHLNEKKTFLSQNSLYIRKEKSETIRRKKSKQFLKLLLYEKIKPMIETYEKILNTQIKKITIKTMRSLWGSCNAKNFISLNLSLVHCPDSIIHYILLHEIAHTIEHNHSSNFWKIVKSVNPDYRNAEKWLKEEGKNYIYYLN